MNPCSALFVQISGYVVNRVNEILCSLDLGNRMAMSEISETICNELDEKFAAQFKNSRKKNDCAFSFKSSASGAITLYIKSLEAQGFVSVMLGKNGGVQRTAPKTVFMSNDAVDAPVAETQTSEALVDVSESNNDSTDDEDSILSDAENDKGELPIINT